MKAETRMSGTRCLPVRLFAAVLAFGLLLGIAPARAGDDDDGNPVAPRVVVEIGGVTVVLIAADGKLHAFVDRVDNNAPADDATLTITTAEGTPVTLNQVSQGLFVGPFALNGRLRDTFVVSVNAAAGTGDAIAEIIYQPPSESAVAGDGGGFRDKVLIALAAGGIGILLGSMIVRRRGQKRPALRPI